MQVVTHLLPEGTMARMMNDSMAPLMDTMMSNTMGSPQLALAELTGLDPFAFNDMDEKRLEQAIALLDPGAESRASTMSNLFLDVIGEIVVEIEPAYRAGLARAYAIRFTKTELLDLNAYFQTEIGSKYASESYSIFADPQVMSSMNDMMPAVMGRMPDMIEQMSALFETGPPAKSFFDLSDQEKQRLSELLEVDIDELEASAPQPPEGAVESTYEES